MRPYKTRGRWYSIDQAAVRYPCASLKSSRAQAGAHFTIARRGTTQNPGRVLGSVAVALALYGTLDPLARSNMMKRHRNAFYKQVPRWVRREPASVSPPPASSQPPVK